MNTIIITINFFTDSKFYVLNYFKNCFKNCRLFYYMPKLLFLSNFKIHFLYVDTPPNLEAFLLLLSFYVNIPFSLSITAITKFTITYVGITTFCKFPNNLIQNVFQFLAYTCGMFFLLGNLILQFIIKQLCILNRLFVKIIKKRQ